MLNLYKKTERGHALVWGVRKAPGRFLYRLATPSHGRAFFMDPRFSWSKEGIAIMATALLAASTNGVIAKSTRLTQRFAYGDVPATIAAGDDELAHRQLENAWVAYRYALGLWLRDRWVEHCGRITSTIHDPLDLAQKLQSACIFDSWTFFMVKMALKKPETVSLNQVNIVAAIVKTVTGGASCPSE